MKPTYEEMLNGNVRWREKHRDIHIELSFHGYSRGEFPSMGTWCYYLLLDQRMFNADDWNMLVMEKKIVEPYGHISYNYYKFPDVEFHGGITFYEITEHWDNKKRETYNVIKVGCDYNHYWDGERGYPDTYDSVLRDAKDSVDELLDLVNITKLCCAWSGIWDDANMFYEAINGKMVHKSMLDDLKQRDYGEWLPKGE